MRNTDREDESVAFDFTVRTKQDLIDAVRTFGIVPFFRNSIPGFSLEEHVVPSVWYTSESAEWPAWEWKGPAILEANCAYGKFFEKKAAFVSPEWLRELANYRRDGYDFDARYDDGLSSRKDKDLFDLIDANAPVLSRTVKALGNYRKGGRTGFETSLTRLQEQCYVITGDFVYPVDRHGNRYGWGTAQYTTPERFFGTEFSDAVYSNSPERSRGLLLEHLSSVLPGTEEKDLIRFLK